MRNVKKMLGALLAGAAVVAVSGTASAEGFSANVALTSDYVWRGGTQSDGGPAIQGGFDYESDLFYVGTWGSSVDPGSTGVTGGEIELDLYAGITPSLGPVTFNIGAIAYFYPDADVSGDWVEAILGAEYSPVEPLTLGLTTGFSSDVFNSGEDSVYVEGAASYAFSDAFEISGAYANFDMGALGDYDTWNLGATVSYHGFAFDFRYHDTDISGVDESFVFTISRAL